MIKVDDVRKTSELAQAKGARKAGSAENFADYLRSGNVSENKQVQATFATTPAEAIFAAQMIDGEEERQIRKKLIKRGQQLLDDLEEIRDSLLLGEVSQNRLIEISRMVKQKDVSAADEKLKEILEEIELRVEVELAKLTNWK